MINPASLSISKADYDFFLNNRDTVLFDYAVQEEIIQNYLKSNPRNVSKNIVKKKIHLLNSFYHTRVPVNAMVQNILKIKDLDNRLKNGDYSLVEEIAQSEKDYLSFATKFCAMHNPDKFPIFDSFLNRIFAYLNEKGFFKGTLATQDKLKHFGQASKSKSSFYADYVIIYDEFMKKSGISSFTQNYREVDRVIWGAAILRLRTLDKTAKSNRDISPILRKVFGDIFMGIASNAIWELVSKVFM